MRLATFNKKWYKADEGKHFVLTEKGKEEHASYRSKTVGEPVNEYADEATKLEVDKGYLIEVSISNWIEKIGYRVLYNCNGHKLSAGNPIVFPERFIAEKYMNNYKKRPWFHEELYIVEDTYKGIKPSDPVYYKGKQVFDESWYFGTDALEIGDLVTEEIVDFIGGCVPPAWYSNTLIQCGEPSDHKFDERTGETRSTYTTFKKVDKNVWEYCGDCFRGGFVK